MVSQLCTSRSLIGKVKRSLALHELLRNADADADDALSPPMR